MLTFGSYREFSEETLSCGRCGWSGSGVETDAALVMNDGLLAQYHCPHCAEHLAIAPWAHVHNLRR